MQAQINLYKFKFKQIYTNLVHLNMLKGVKCFKILIWVLPAAYLSYLLNWECPAAHLSYLTVRWLL